MEEVWSEVEGFDNYVVSNTGVVREVVGTVTKQVATRPHPNGSIRVILRRANIERETYVHVLVAEAFLPDYEPGKHVRHIDGDKTNNNVGNLEMKSPTPVRRDYEIITTRWIQVRQIALSLEERRLPSLIREGGGLFPDVESASRELNITPSGIYKCLNGERSSHAGYTFEWIGDEEYIWW